ncbi:hypothetical protein GYMLUDRAFT_466210 [Collybiopsis luxurians FD-317 M1]|uniref:MACPF domain-containing protein n=1 Tax=Collybiopsis luxurians FD-317 M1 TaxID=944289 RepID=A0A0D0C5G4_9AGAR|nr:hypothetical protein GYMLUDRAFT_466210 [Collybiopsis luxurians FD-317 M1]
MAEHNTASLSTVIENVPRNTFQLGQGVDALTGQARGRALAYFKNPTRSVGPTCNIRTRMVEEFHQLDSDVRIASNATINLGTPAVSLAQTAELLKSRSLSKREFIIECTVEGQYDYDMLNLENLKLTAEARKVFQRSPAEFRNMYGDYFVAGFQRRYRSYTIIICRAGDQANTTDARLEAQGHFQSFLSLGADLKRSVMGSSKYTIVNAYVSQYGCHADTGQHSGVVSVPSETDFHSALMALKNTVSHAMQYQGTPKEANLMHYSLLGINLPTEINVSPMVFEKLHRTEEHCMRLDIDCLHPALDSYKLIMQEAHEATRAFRAGRPGLAGGDASRCNIAIQKVNEAMEEVTNMIQRYKFMEHLLSLKRAPAIRKRVTLGKNAPNRQSYGVVETEPSAEPDHAFADVEPVTLRNGLPAFQVTLQQDKLKDEKAWWQKEHPNTHFKIEKRTPSHTFWYESLPTGNNSVGAMVVEEPLSLPGHDIKIPSANAPENLELDFKKWHYERDDFYIVGWTIKSENSDGSSFHVKYGGVMENNLGIVLTKGSHWTCRIVYILKKDYYFPALLNAHGLST